MKKAKKNLQGLRALLPQLSQQRGWEEQLALHSVFDDWPQLVDKEVAAHCRPLKIVKRVLWVEVDNNAWLQQLQYQTVHLVEILNNSLSQTKLKGIRFCVAQGGAAKVKPKEVMLRYVQPPAEDIAAFESQVGTISDEESREALMRFWYLSKACKRE